MMSKTGLSNQNINENFAGSGTLYPMVSLSFLQKGEKKLDTALTIPVQYDKLSHIHVNKGWVGFAKNLIRCQPA